MTAIRWYAMTGGGNLLYANGEPVIFLAPDKHHAIDYVAHRWHYRPDLKPVSVVEWEVMQRDKSAAQRFIRHADEWWKNAMARDRVERETQTGQLEMEVAA